MNAAIYITATLDKPDLLANLVEKLATRRYDIGYINAQLPGSMKALETSSTETFISGSVDLSEIGHEMEAIHMPFITRFFFTCVKEKKSDYRMAWSSSLN